MKKILTIIIALLFVSSCGKTTSKLDTIEGYQYTETKEVTNYVKILTNRDKIILIELYPDEAPITVANFQKLVSKKYYDGTIFHRVIADFMIQTGGFTTQGLLEEVPTIKGEFKNNGIENPIKHDTGIVSMARAQDMDSASNQFFICVNSKEYLNYLDGDYAAFGKVIAGYENVLEISKVKTNDNDMPLKVESIKTIRFVKVKK